jgi:hypothetical protein
MGRRLLRFRQEVSPNNRAKWHAECVLYGPPEIVPPGRRRAVKITGLILALIGLVAIAICTISVVYPTHPDASSGPVGPGQIASPSIIVPMVISTAAVVVGALMFMFGGKGYFISNNPRVRN